MPRDVILPGGAWIPGDALGPCPKCKGREGAWEVARRWVEVKDISGNPAEMELVSAQCPACCALGPDGRNRHGRRERRVRLGWMDATTGEITLEPESTGENAS